MDRTRWQRLQDLFLAAREVEGDEREQLLQAHGAADREVVDEVRSLLAGDVRRGILDVAPVRRSSANDVSQETSPVRIGAYRVIRQLGQGGMGVVYLAERADGHYEQRVAIKLLRAADTEGPLYQRFLAERQILAGLVHPNIGRLLDGGVADDGRPYFVLEYVDGLAITDYCDRHRLDLPTRLRLFSAVCVAVQHAHQSLIIHRDLKPSNILVSVDGRVHLLDFGIAKLLDPESRGLQSLETRVDLRVMTPAFASPEQVRGHTLTTASDIYSLGVLLYELLCGRSPYRLTSGSLIEVGTAVCEQEPEPPSVRAASDREAAERRATTPDALASRLAGDLDGIVLMAMRKEPASRYPSADALREDIARHVNGLSVVAHRGSRRYRVVKALRRRKVETAATALVFSALAIGLQIALVQRARANRERDRAEQARAQSEGVTTFLMELFRTGDQDEPRPPTQLSALDLVHRGAQRAAELSDQPVVQARLLDVVGQMSFQLARYDEAQRWLEEAVAIRRKILGPGSLDLATSLIHLARVHRARNDYDRASPIVAEALSIRRRALPPRDPAIADAIYESAWLTAGAPQELLYREALAILHDTVSTATAEQTVTILQALSTNLRRQGRLAEALSTDREALRVAEQAFGRDHHETGAAMIHLADHVRDIEQDLTGAEQLLRRGLELIARRHGENSVRAIHGLNSLASLVATRVDSGNEAEQLYRRALAIRQAATGPAHPQLAEQLHFLAGELARQGRLGEAEALARQALEMSRQTLGPQHLVIFSKRLPALAYVLDQQGQHHVADETYNSAFALASRSADVFVGEMRRDYGEMLTRRGDYARAERELLESVTRLERFYQRSDHPNVHETKRALIELYRRWGRADMAERYRVPPGRYIPY